MTAADRARVGPITHWLTAGPGFALVALMFSTAVTFLVSTYISNQQVESRILRNRIAALSLIRAEAEDNLNRTRDNMRNIRRVLPQPDIYPGFEHYLTAAWRMTTNSESMLTLRSEYFIQLATLYEDLEATNFEFSTLESQLIRIDVRSVTPAQYRSEQEHRKRMLLSILDRSERLSGKGSILSAIGFTKDVIRVSTLELEAAEYWLKKAQLAQYVLLAIYVIVVIEILNLAFSEITQGLFSRFRRKTLLDRLDEIGR